MIVRFIVLYVYFKRKPTHISTLKIFLVEPANVSSILNLDFLCMENRFLH